MIKEVESFIFSDDLRIGSSCTFQNECCIFHAQISLILYSDLPVRSNAGTYDNTHRKGCQFFKESHIILIRAIRNSISKKTKNITSWVPTLKENLSEITQIKFDSSLVMNYMLGSSIRSIILTTSIIVIGIIF